MGLVLVRLGSAGADFQVGVGALPAGSKERRGSLGGGDVEAAFETGFVGQAQGMVALAHPGEFMEVAFPEVGKTSLDLAARDAEVMLAAIGINEHQGLLEFAHIFSA